MITFIALYKKNSLVRVLRRIKATIILVRVERNGILRLIISVAMIIYVIIDQQILLIWSE
ncbi:MAG: hypothetical protein CML67_08595 [Rhodobacteraceae bacterium]|nr:hypothetical protein [Paracoccaceae bacterium]